MKKTTKRLLSLGLCAALALSVGCGLAACGGNDDGKTETKPKASSYWLAGIVQGTTEWDNPTASTRLSTTSNSKVFEITLDLWQGDSFKVRCDGKKWTEFQVNYNNGYTKEQKEEADAKITDASTVPGADGGYPGERNFGVAVEGNYTLKLTLGADNNNLSYTYNGEAAVKAPKPVTGITLNEPTLELEVGETFKLVATVRPADADDPSVIWESDDEDVVTVDDEGNVTAVAEGEATIIAYAGEKSVECPVTVVAEGAKVTVEKVELNKTETTLHVGQEETLEATVTPADATGAVAYTSSDEEVATVDAATGKITAIGPGTATITASQGGKSATCEVTVPTDYYLRGDCNGWGKVANLTTDNVFYLTETETAGIYKTQSVELKKGAGFQIAIVGAKGNNPEGDNGWVGAITNTALSTEAPTTTYMEAAANGDNIVVKTRGMYTVTLDTTGETPVVSCFQDDTLPEEIAIYYLIGGGVAQGWTTADTTADVATGCLFTDVDGVLTATVTLEKDAEFKVAIVGSAWTGALGSSAVLDPNGVAALSTDGDNIKALKAGTFVITIDPATSKISYTFTPAAEESGEDA